MEEVVGELEGPGGRRVAVLGEDRLVGRGRLGNVGRVFGHGGGYTAAAVRVRRGYTAAASRRGYASAARRRRRPHG